MSPATNVGMSMAKHGLGRKVKLDLHQHQQIQQKSNSHMQIRHICISHICSPKAPSVPLFCFTNIGPEDEGTRLSLCERPIQHLLPLGVGDKTALIQTSIPIRPGRSTV